jgi:hypothetical protein
MQLIVSIIFYKPNSGKGLDMDVDLKLLTVFEEVYKTGSVSQAAANIGATQLAISIGLGKLRRLLNDPLFVRTSRGMEPTVSDPSTPSASKGRLGYGKTSARPRGGRNLCSPTCRPAQVKGGSRLASCWCCSSLHI